MILKNRVIWSDNGTLIDISNKMNDFISGTQTLALTASEDYLFLGSEYPFNNRWVEVATANDQASAISSHVWDGDTWEATVEFIDETADSSGNSLAQSGRMTWVPDREEGWLRDDTNGTTTNDPITGLDAVTIYDLYWTRLTFSADLNAATEISYIGQKFSNDADLRLLYPELLQSDVLTNWEAGKTTWDQQHFAAADEIEKALKRKHVTVSRDQILNPDLFTTASVHKVAEIIYRGFGNDFVTNHQQALKDFNEAMDLSIFDIDQDRNARLSPSEHTRQTGFMTR